MSVTNFTVEYDLLALAPDSLDMGADVDLVALIGEVDFIAQFSDSKAIQAPTYDPRPTGFKVLKFTGYLDTDGRLKSARSGAIGVRLPALDPTYGIDRLVYRVEFRLTTPVGQRVNVDPGYLEAPDSDITVNLATELATTGSAASPVNRIAPGAVRMVDGKLQFSYAGVDIPDAVDLPLLSNSVSSLVGNGTSTSIAVAHNLDTLDVQVSVYEVATGVEVDCDVTHTDGNTVTLSFASAPATDSLRCVVIGTAFGLGSPTPTTSLTIADASAFGRTWLTSANAAAAKPTLALTAADVGLPNVDNTSDLDKPISTAAQTALNGKVPTTRTVNTKALSSNVTLTQDDVGDGTTYKQYSASDKTRLANTSGTNTGDQTSVSGNAGTAAALQTARNIDGQPFNGTANITVIAPGTNAATSKETPVDADEMPLVDSAASNVLKKLTWANLKATLMSYFASSAVAVSTLEVGNASDTTVSRSAAGKIAVEGVDVLLTSDYASAATASKLAIRDSNANLTSDAFIATATSTATAAGTTTLTIDSSQVQVFTGSTTQTVKLPTTGVVAGQHYIVINQSSGAVTVQSSGGNTIVTLTTTRFGLFVAYQDTPTSSTHWKALSPSDGTTNTLNTLALRDPNNGWLNANVVTAIRTSVATAAGTTTMSAASNQIQVFTGTTTQTVKLPTTSILAGMQYTVINQSSGDVTVQSSGANTVATLTGGTQDAKLFVALKDTPTAAADWRVI